MRDHEELKRIKRAQNHIKDKYDKIHIIDLRNREKVFEILNVPQQVGSLKQQTEQLLRLA